MTLVASSTYAWKDVVSSKRPETAALIAIFSDTSHLGCNSAPAMNWYSSNSRLAASQSGSFSLMMILDTGYKLGSQIFRTHGNRTGEVLAGRAGEAATGVLAVNARTRPSVSPEGARK